MSSRLQRDETLEKEDRIDEMKKIKISPPIPHLLQAQQAPVLPYAKVVGRPSTGSYPAPSPDPTTQASISDTLGENATKLSDQEAENLEGEITLTELTKALKNMKNDKSSV